MHIHSKVRSIIAVGLFSLASACGTEPSEPSGSKEEALAEISGAATAPDCSPRTETHTDPNTGKTWSTVWYCGNFQGNVFAAPRNNAVATGIMQSTVSWFTCYSRGDRHSGGNEIWYYTQGDVASDKTHHAWGYMPASNVKTHIDPYPGIPICSPCGGRACAGDEFCSANRCCPVDRCVTGCPCL